MGIDQLKIDVAMWGERARGLLERASRQGRPYDTMLLDLRLPEKKGDHDSVKVGLGLLKKASRLGAVHESIVVSVLTDFEWVSKAYHRGAADYVGKPIVPADLTAAVLRSWDRSLLKASTRILDERIRTLVPHAARGLAYRFGSCFSGLLQRVVNTREGLRTELADRLALDAARDKEDSLVTRIADLERAERAARDDWAELSKSLGDQQTKAKRLSLHDLTADAKRELEPCLIAKRVALKQPGTASASILSFGNDVRTVIRELICGALNELPDYPDDGVSLKLSVERREAEVELTMSEDLPPISRHDAELINKAMAVAPESTFGRAWGLSVVQHTALRGGGRLVVEPSTNGNTIRYLIPRALNA